MAALGKSINLFLMDSVVTGRIKCTLPNWTGVAYKIPRTDLGKCKTRNDLKQSGVYFLFGKSDQTGDDVVYVGQAGTRKNGKGILCRLLEHTRNPDKDYWTEAITFTTSNNSFGPTEISYLENRFTTLALAAKRYHVANGNEPNPGNITEEKKSELEDFIDYAKTVMGILGHKVFIAKDESVPAPDPVSNTVPEEAELFLKTSKVDAQGKRNSDGFIVLKDSLVASSPTPSCPAYVRELRKKFAEKITKKHRLSETLSFSSPSSAAAFASYASANGLICWHTASGKTLKEIETEQA